VNFVSSCAPYVHRMCSLAKIVNKIMAGRHALKLPGLVSSNQSAFVKGRSIHDNYLMVQQTARAVHKQKDPVALLKLDIGKAFDSVSWPFLFEVLRHLGFGPLWCNMIAKLLHSSSTRVLVNGEPRDLICHERGLRQGDPLSLMLFILVMDVLNYLIQKASNLGLLQPLLRRGSGQRVSLYADDVVLFLKPKEEEFAVIKEIIWIFGMASGLITNLNKCSLTPIQCEEQDIVAAQFFFLPCRVLTFSCKYLGLPLSVRKLPRSVFLDLINKVADKLPRWKAALLHPAGRAVLVKSVLSAIPVYHLIALQCPKWVVKAIDKIRRGFLWKGRTVSKVGIVLLDGQGYADHLLKEVWVFMTWKLWVGL
jgi:hypothetical protein